MTPEERMHNGSRAREVLDNEQFQAAFEAIESELIEAWKTSPQRDADGREKIFTYLTLLAKVKTQLESTIETGKLAKLDIEHKRTLMERAKAFL